MEDQFIAFKIGQEEYAVQISQVKEIINYTAPTRIPSIIEAMLGVINLRDKLIPIIELGERMGIQSQKELDEKKIIIIDNGVKASGVVVDEVAEVIKVQEDDIEKVSTHIGQGNNYMKGIAKKDKRLIIIVDLKVLIGGEENNENYY